VGAARAVRQRQVDAAQHPQAVDTPTSGTARWRDHDLGARAKAELTRYRASMSASCSSSINLIRAMTARENVALVTEMADKQR